MDLFFSILLRTKKDLFNSILPVVFRYKNNK